ncbi:hypothetical protein D878_gp01 [Sulfolobales Mexican rudivirus 1]|uniref:Uncharacterized protein n=1 Tax=Sulfolobales Mexican rod-shaped virus 1 TaxID=2848122 RepID=K4NZ95_9VIRU|nr:hypothetical protein D878_gp01 [Sulfolobales Mexican rudivirus 1]AFV51228.1 hypothetical protein [Sulfolobales Mexican rod-shaped virus 1]
MAITLIIGTKLLILNDLSPKFLKLNFYTAVSYMVLGESKMVENVKNTGSNPEAEEIFVSDPAPGELEGE